MKKKILFTRCNQPSQSTWELKYVSNVYLLEAYETWMEFRKCWNKTCYNKWIYVLILTPANIKYDMYNSKDKNK